MSKIIKYFVIATVLIAFEGFVLFGVGNVDYSVVDASVKFMLNLYRTIILAIISMMIF